MKLYLILFTMSFSFIAQALHIDSDYAGAEGKKVIEEKCMQFITENEFAEIAYECPVMAEASDYGVQVMFWDHGVATQFSYKGEPILEDEDFVSSMSTGKLWQNKLPSSYEVSWANWGLANGTFEWRYKMVDGKKVPFAVIFRKSFVSLAFNSDNPTDEWSVASKSSALIVVKLDGKDSKMIGAVDSILAYDSGANANILARECADSLVAEHGNQDSCSSFNPYLQEEPGIQ